MNSSIESKSSVMNWLMDPVLIPPMLLIFLPLLAFVISSWVSAPKSPLANLPMPERKSWLLGNRKDTDHLKPGEIEHQYQKQLGNVFLFPDMAGGKRLTILDVKAIQFVCNDIESFQSNSIRTEMIFFIIGKGLVGQYGQTHRRQRKSVAPSFTNQNIKSLYPEFMTTATSLAQQVEKSVVKGGDEKWNKLCSKNDKSKSVVINVATFMNCSALDVIGRCGFGFDFKALEQGEEATELSRGFKSLIEASLAEFTSGFVFLILLSAFIYTPACVSQIRVLRKCRCGFLKLIRFLSSIPSLSEMASHC